MTAVLQSLALKHFVIGAAAGALAAAHVDYAAFVTWNSAKDALSYDWKVAVWRWFKGAVIGGVSTGALGTFVG